MTAPDCPRINVNPKKCDDALTCVSSEDECKAAPILIPCPIPRSVVFNLDGVKAACSIRGATWEDTSVDDVEFIEHGPEATDAGLERIARERWPLLKALVLGVALGDYEGWCGPSLSLLRALFAQRDAVYAALADMARAEEATCAARDAVRRAMGLPPSKPLAHELRESAIELGDYVERLIEQVGVLP